MSNITKQQLYERYQALEKELQLELASADLMDECLRDWACNMREMAKHNIRLADLLQQIMIYCDLSEINLGHFRDRIVDLLFSEDQE